jgi:hypothetical protein
LPALQLGSSTFDRDRGNLPSFPLINMIAEEVPIEEAPILQSRPGLTNVTSMGSAPIRQLFYKDGILQSRLFGISGYTLYEAATPIDDIDGDGFVSMDGYETNLFINAGLQVWNYDGTNLNPIAIPDSSNVINIVVGMSRLVVIKKDTGRIYWSDPLTATIGGLQFATAENSPDRLKQLLFKGDTLILFGAETVEFWMATQNDELPFQPIIGRTMSVGIRDTGCATLFNTSFAWITETNQIFFGDQATNISNPSIDEKIAKSSTAKLWNFFLEGVEYLALTLEDQTWILSSKTSRWSLFESYGEDNWIPHCYANGFFGSSLNGSLSQWSDDHSDFGGILERRFRAGAPIPSGVVPIYNLSLITNQGQTPFLEGIYADPKVEMRLSKDGGFTWTPYYTRSLKPQGHYLEGPQWRSMGTARTPGLLAEFRVTDPVPFRVSQALLNEGYEDA